MLTGASKIIRATSIADNSPTMKDNYEKANAKSERFARFYKMFVVNINAPVLILTNVGWPYVDHYLLGSDKLQLALVFPTW